MIVLFQKKRLTQIRASQVSKAWQLPFIHKLLREEVLYFIVVNYLFNE